MNMSPLHVLYEDNHCIAVFKPAGLLTQGDRSGDSSLFEQTKAWIKEKYHKPGNVFLGLVHRLDRPVSGVVLFAKTSKCASRLCEAFRLRKIRKEYLAVVEGCIRGQLKDFLRIETPLIWSESGIAIVSYTEVPSKLASLSYRAIKAGKNTTLLEIHLETGRKHQIRAQLSYLGHPIVGDLRYGASTDSRVLPLICKRLTYEHPTKKNSVVIEAPDALFDVNRWLT